MRSLKISGSLRDAKEVRSKLKNKLNALRR